MSDGLSESLNVQLNGKPRSFAGLVSPVGLLQFVEAAGLHADRIAVELNGEIAPRSKWAGVYVTEGDKLEIVHFVGGGTS